ncbi:DUF2213 domain-containing protein [Orbaceae bacterium ac157xtp]
MSKEKGIISKIKELLANDSARTKDINGYLSVVDCNISKATVNPYYGKDIPNWQELGLIPDKIYNLLRDPDELSKAVHTFNGLPLLSEHVPISAKEIPKDKIIGCVGTNAHFNGSFVVADVAVWDEQDIVLIEENKKKELSSSYFYRADMTSGEFNGVQYDGIMRDIHGNHVAVVERGRAGSEVAVADSDINITEKELNNMKLSDFKKLFSHILANDAKDEDIEKALKAAKANDEDLENKPKSEDEDVAEDEDEIKDDKKADDSEEDKTSDDEEDDKKANDAALIEKRVVERFKRLNQAQMAVRPYLGELAMDSAEDIYLAGLKHFGVDVSDLPKSAYKATFDAVSKANQVKKANDSAMPQNSGLLDSLPNKKYL